ncbi:PTS sugar transporter subunit IIB [Microbacterium lushaniae]|uniref:PTS sugar transporter n=1 Tax=Microbacterium lushaniae TaxID=2614639 RepID=A0A5J6L1M2_9MICO|nr:PTS sugar transporter [Microbacterium lushaniae]QEW02429.1 PTS sugar transporter [Microbacterium lushaniae]
MRILVICGAGASSTFVAQRVRRAAHEHGLPYSAVAGTTGSLAIDLDSADIVLVGPHLAAERDRIERSAAALDVAVAVLPEDIFSDLTGERTLDLVRATLAGRPDPLSTTDTNA